MNEHQINSEINSFIKWKILKKIASLKLKKEISLIELSHLIEIERTHPYYCQLLSFLFNNEAIIHTKTIGVTKFIKVNNKKLRDILISSIYYKEVEHLVKVYNPAFHNLI